MQDRRLTALAVVSYGDPRHHGTWSGTPANLCREFERLGVQVTAINSDTYLARPLVLGCKLLHKLYYAGSPYMRWGWLERPLRARHVETSAQNCRVAHVLHFNTYALPPRADKVHEAGQLRRRHYLFTDTTWHLWRQQVADAARINRRLIRDAESLERRAYHACAHIFSISEYAKRDLCEHYGVAQDRISVVGTGRGPIQPSLNAKDYRQKTVLFVAKVRAQDKGVHQLLAAFHLARRIHPEMRLILAGREDYHELAKDDPAITVHGHVSLERLETLFEEASLFAMPARNEPWGLVYLEALSCQVPVLGLRRNALPEITREGRYGFCVETDSPQAIADALCDAFSDPARLARMGAEGQAYCLETFTWERTARRILEVVAEQPAEIGLSGEQSYSALG